MYIDEWNEAQIITLATQANLTAMRKACFMLEADVKQSYPKKGAGRTVKGRWVEGKWYRIHGKRHYASRPGTPPAVMTGGLKSSTHSEIYEGPLNIRGFVGSGLPYAMFLETGTSKMKPRPYLRPALHRQERDIERLFREANS